MSRWPWFQLHFEVLYALVARERLDGFAPPGMDGSNTATLETLQSYFNVKLPAAGEELKFKLPNDLHEIVFHCPKENEDQLIAHWGYVCLFRALDVGEVIAFLSALLQERQIIVVCRTLGLLSAVVLSCIPLLRPMAWQGTFIPILPVDQLDVLHAPVPYVIGVPAMPEEIFEELDMDEIVVVNIDQVLSFLLLHRPIVVVWE